MCTYEILSFVRERCQFGGDRRLLLFLHGNHLLIGLIGAVRKKDCNV